MKSNGSLGLLSLFFYCGFPSCFVWCNRKYSVAMETVGAFHFAPCVPHQLPLSAPPSRDEREIWGGEVRTEDIYSLNRHPLPHLIHRRSLFWKKSCHSILAHGIVEKYWIYRYTDREIQTHVLYIETHTYRPIYADRYTDRYIQSCLFHASSIEGLWRPLYS